MILFRIYGSVEALEGEERVARNRRFRIETASDTEVYLFKVYLGL